jgi:hypothetical protein
VISIRILKQIIITLKLIIMKKLILTSASFGRNAFVCQDHAPMSVKSSLQPLGLKRLMVLLIVFLLSTQFVSAQKSDTAANGSAQASYDFYMQRHKTNNTIGWLLLGSGVTMTTVGAAIGTNNIKYILTPGYNSHKGEAVAFAGGLMALVSIPFFISAGGSRRKAYLSLKKEKVSIGERGPAKVTFAAISFKIKF